MRRELEGGMKWLWCAVVALAAMLPYALKVGPDHDLWWHLKTGQLILAERGLPETDPFSFTAAGAAWTNHEWLADVILAGVFALGGDRALMLWRVALLLAVGFGLVRLLWIRLPHPLFLLAGALLLAPLVRIFINFRPHAYTYLLTVVLVSLVEASRRRPRLLWIVPPLMVLWTNLHGGFLLGLGLLALGLGARAAGLDSDAPRPPRAELRRLAAVFALSLAATLVNPYGPGLYVYLAQELGADHSLVLEWRGIWSFEQHRLQFVLLLLVPAAAIAVARRAGPPMPLALLAVSTWGTWTHGRFLILLAIFSGLVTFSALGSLARTARGMRPEGILGRLRSAGWAWGLCLLPLAAGIAQAASDYQRKGLRIVVDAWTVPLEGREFLQRHDLGPNLLLRFDWGGYAIWHLHPRYKVSVDGRNLTVYDAEFVDRQIRAYHERRFAAYAAEQGADVILTERAGPAYEELRASPDWVRVHEDRVSAVFVPPDVARGMAHRRAAAAPARPAAERFYFP